MTELRGPGPAQVTMRAMTEADLPALFEIQRDPDGQFMAAFTDPRTRDDRDAYLAKHRRLLADETIIKCVVLADGELAGSAACFEMDGDKEVTYWIRKDLWGRGVATAALAGLLAEVTHRPLFGRVAADNTASARVLERNGFRQVGEETSFAEARGLEIKELIYKLD
jgi:[ribosomal protein S5]-alanine N-acetyltransferase